MGRQLAPSQEQLQHLQVQLHLPGCHQALQLPSQDEEEEETPPLRHHTAGVLAVLSLHQPLTLRLRLHPQVRRRQLQHLGQLLLPRQASSLRLELLQLAAQLQLLHEAQAYPFQPSHLPLLHLLRHRQQQDLVEVLQRGLGQTRRPKLVLRLPLHVHHLQPSLPLRVHQDAPLPQQLLNLPKLRLAFHRLQRFPKEEEGLPWALGARLHHHLPLPFLHPLP